MTLRLPRCLLLLGILGLARGLVAQERVMQPDDLFRIERVGDITWTRDRRYAAVELTRPGRWLDSSIPTSELAVVKVASGTMQTISPTPREILGYFGAAWSPDSRRLLFLSIDTNAVIRPWLWAPGRMPRLLSGLEIHESLADPPVALWSDNEHAVFLLHDPASPRDGMLYHKITRGRNVADKWTRARAGKTAAVSVLESRAPEDSALDAQSGLSRLVSVNLRTNAVTTLVRGALHLPRMSDDGRTLTYRSEEPTLTRTPMSLYFGPEATGEKAYDLPNYGRAIHHVDPRTGAPVPPPASARPAEQSGSGVALRVVNDKATGTQLLLSRPDRPDIELWRGNRWSHDIVEGRAEPITYTSRTGTALTGWILYPPGYVAGRRIPMVTVVYPGTMYSERVPSSFSVLNSNFEHPQLFAAKGYGVVFPSMPAPGNPLRSDAIDSLVQGVLPLLDTLIARGVADSTRMAVLGQSAGGYATIALITQTDRFRTAIASASYANLASQYGTFYGQYRHGDAGNPQRAQVLRMLQFERGFHGADAPPWEAPELYRLNSPIWRINQVHTPLMLIHGEDDFIPIQQAEEVFTALYRQDKRVRFVRYTGEEHTISARANVLDMWQRIESWLTETMQPGQGDMNRARRPQSNAPRR